MATGRTSLHKTNWNKFEEAIIDVVRKEVSRAFLWLYKGGNKYVGDYLAEIPGGKKGLKKKEKDTLEKRQPPTNMDISLLYYLLQRTCGLAEVNDPVWTDNSSSSVEHTLYLIKEERNKLSHEGHTQEAQEMSDAELEQNLNNLRDLCATLLTEAAKKCGRSGETNKLINEMETRMREIQGVTVERFVLMAREEMLKKSRTKMSDDWYQQPLLKLQNHSMGVDELLQSKAPGGAGPSFFLVSGEAGAGKSSLCRYLEESWLRPRSDGKDLVQHHRLVLRLHCRDIYTFDVMRLLREKLLPETASQCSNVTLQEVLSAVPILWLLDGLDEATEEAIKLLSSFLDNHRLKGTVVLTSRPEFRQDFLRQHSNKGIQLVSLLGADPLEAIQSIILSTKCDEDTVRHAKRLMEEFMKLDPYVQVELCNPLKLRLALQDWEALRTSTLRQEFELGRLYQKITENQIESLSQKVSEGPVIIMTMSEATRKVRQWFSFLCESTFHLFLSKTPFTDATRKEFLKKLDYKCDDLQISSSKCLSTFLASPDSVFSTGHSSYTFYHDSQVHFLAALHIDSVMKESKDLHADTTKLFNNVALQEHTSEEPPLQHFLHVLQLLVSLVDDSTPDDNVRMVIKLLINAMPSCATDNIMFYCAKKASYEPKVMREIGRVMTDTWIISNTNTEASRRMLEYRQPKCVTLIINNPETEEFKSLLSTIANFPIAIHLQQIKHFIESLDNNTSDSYLEIICREGSQCFLVECCGYLGDKGYDLLEHPNISNSCTVIACKIKSVKSLETLATRVQHLKALKRIFVNIKMKELQYTSAKFSNINISIILHSITKETAEKTANFVAGLSQSYNDITIMNDVPESVKQTFSRHLQQKGVKVEKLIIVRDQLLSVLLTSWIDPQTVDLDSALKILSNIRFHIKHQGVTATSPP